MPGCGSHDSSPHSQVLSLLMCIAAVTVGCTETLPLPPRLDVVSPAEVIEGVGTTLVLKGRFHLMVRVSYRDEGRSKIDGNFLVRIGSTALQNVTYVDGATLEAQLPAAFAAGIYDVTVADPRGDTATLSGALTVTPQRETASVNNVMLYDRDQDPTESHNLSNDPAHRDLVAT